MVPTLPADLQNLQDALDAAERDSRAVVAGLTEARGSWHADAGIVERCRMPRSPGHRQPRLPRCDGAIRRPRTA